MDTLRLTHPAAARPAAGPAPVAPQRLWLLPRHAVALDVVAGTRLGVDAGAVWLTASGDPDDHVVAAGGSHTVARATRVVLESHGGGAAAVRVHVPRGASPWVVAVAAARAVHGGVRGLGRVLQALRAHTVRPGDRPRDPPPEAPAWVDLRGLDERLLRDIGAPEALIARRRAHHDAQALHLALQWRDPGR